jgi:hypothetical protein
LALLTVTNVAGWFGALAAQIQQQYSYFADVDAPDSITRIFFAWRSLPPQFLDLKYAGDVLRFTCERFPATFSDFSTVDYGAAKVELLEYLGHFA